MKFFYDLHIHSVLSPDADDLMTPNNILNMAMLKELDFLSITDHNSTKQLKVVEQIEDAYDFVFIPGIEVTVAEGFDVLCYFKTYEAAYKIDKIVETYLTDDFGPWTAENQMITDVYDITIETFNKSLRKTTMPINILIKEVRNLDGVIVFAHIERNSKSVLNKYTIDDFDHDGVEIQAYHLESFLNDNPRFKKEIILTSSDSHQLLQISEKNHFLDLPEKSVEAFFNYFKR